VHARRAQAGLQRGRQFHAAQPAVRLISTGQLRQSLVLPSTSGLSTRWSSREPLGDEPRGNLSLESRRSKLSIRIVYFDKANVCLRSGPTDRIVIGTSRAFSK
jgi:hypothetical protein